jgi:hypothetical protein
MKKYKIRNWIIKGDQRQTIRRRERVANWRWRSCWTTNGATNLFTFLVCCVLFFLARFVTLIYAAVLLTT